MRAARKAPIAYYLYNSAFKNFEMGYAAAISYLLFAMIFVFTLLHLRFSYRDYYKKLIALRKDIPSLHSRQWQPLDAAPSKQVYGYLRYVDPSEQPLLVVLNFSDQELEAEIALPEAFAAFRQQRSLRDLLAEETIAIDGTGPLKLPMPAWRARILASMAP